MDEKDDKDWFDVLTGDKEPSNREEQVFAELRGRILEDADKDDFQLDEFAFKRGQWALRDSIKLQQKKRRLPYLSGLAAGIFAVGLGFSIYLAQVEGPEEPVTKDIGDVLAPSISFEFDDKSSADPVELARILADNQVSFEGEDNRRTTVLRFKTPAPVPDELATWLADYGIAVQAVTRYELTFPK